MTSAERNTPVETKPDTSEAEGARAETPPQIVAWTSFGLRDDPFRGLVAIFVVISTAAAVKIASDTWAAAGAALVFLAYVVRDFFMPTHYALTDERLSIRGASRKVDLSWDRVERIELGDGPLAELTIQNAGRASGRIRLRVGSRVEARRFLKRQTQRIQERKAPA